MLVGIGPGSTEHMTARARAAIAEADTIIGYVTYIKLVADLIEGKEVVRKPMTEELDRAIEALDRARAGKKVALISSGDAGVYGMAGPTFEVLFQAGWTPPTLDENGVPDADGIEVEVVPGASALNSCAARVGAPLTHDFCAISLSDLLTPWPTIARRLDAAAAADPGPPASPALRVGYHRVVPFFHVPRLIRRAEITIRRRAANRGHVAVQIIPVRAVIVVRHVRAGVGNIARGKIGAGHGGGGVTLGGIGPIIVAATRRIVIRRFKPLVLAGNIDGGTHVLGDGTGIPAERVGSDLGAACALAVVHPVGEAGRVIPAHVVHRLIAHVGAEGVFLAAGRAWGVSDAATRIAAHKGIVDAVGIRTVGIGSIEERAILGVVYFVFADLVGVGHRAVE